MNDNTKSVFESFFLLIVIVVFMGLTCSPIMDCAKSTEKIYSTERLHKSIPSDTRCVDCH